MSALQANHPVQGKHPLGDERDRTKCTLAQQEQQEAQTHGSGRHYSRAAGGGSSAE